MQIRILKTHCIRCRILILKVVTAATNFNFCSTG